MLVFPVGVAGCMATLLHDAIMNPAEGKMSHTGVFSLCLNAAVPPSTRQGALQPQQ